MVVKQLLRTHAFARGLWAAALVALTFGTAAGVRAQDAPAPKASELGKGKTGDNYFNYTAADKGVPKEWLGRVGIDQQMDAQVPANLKFKDETGKEVTLGSYFGKKPVMLTMVQFTCTLLCSAQMQAMTSSLCDLDYTAGKEFEVLTVSIDPRETPAIGSGAKEEQLATYQRKGAENGWHFLTGDEANVKALAKAIGYKYFWDDKSNQYVHPDGIVLLTPDGHISRYFMRLEYHPRDLRFGLIEASHGQIGNVLDQVALSCFHYNPVTGKYSFQVMAFLRIMALATILGGVAGISLMLKKEKRRPVARPALAVKKL
jgi:protein SCO1/2